MGSQICTSQTSWCGHISATWLLNGINMPIHSHNEMNKTSATHNLSNMPCACFMADSISSVCRCNFCSVGQTWGRVVVRFPHFLAVINSKSLKNHVTVFLCVTDCRSVQDVPRLMDSDSWAWLQPSFRRMKRVRENKLTEKWQVFCKNIVVMWKWTATNLQILRKCSSKSSFCNVPPAQELNPLLGRL